MKRVVELAALLLVSLLSVDSRPRRLHVYLPAVFSVVGAVVVLVGWCIQVTVAQSSASELATLNTANVARVILESTDLELQAISAANPSTASTIDRLRDQNRKNEETLFANYSKATFLLTDDKGNLLTTEDGTSYLTTDPVVDEAAIAARANRAKWIFIIFNVLGTLLLISGQIAKEMIGRRN